MKYTVLGYLVFPFIFRTVICQEDSTTNAYEDSTTKKITNEDSGNYLRDIEIIKLYPNPYVGNSVHVVWGLSPEENKDNKTYGVFYGTDIDDALREPKLTTTKLSTQVSDLKFCKNYMFAVGVLVEGKSINPNSSNIRSVVTYLDAVAPPQNLRVEFVPDKDPCLLVKWTASCPNIPKPLGFVLSIYEGPRNPNLLLKTSKTTDVERHCLLPVKYGSLYELKVSNDLREANFSETIKYRIPAFMQPYDVHVAVTPEGAFMLYWREPHVPICNHRYFYEVIVFHGSEVTNKTKVDILNVNRPAFVFKGNESEYNFGIQTVCWDKTAKSHLTDLIYANVYGDVVYSDKI